MKTTKYLLIFVCVLISNVDYGQTIRTVTGKIPIDLTTPRHTSKNKTTSNRGVYNAPSNCVILDYTLNVKRKNGPGKGGVVNFVQGGSRYISTQEMNNAFSSSFDLASKLKIKGKELADLKIKLDKKHSEYEKLQNTIEASHATIEHMASMNAQGITTGARSWYNADVTVKLMCLNDYAQSSLKLKKNLKELVQKYSDSISENRVINSAEDKFIEDTDNNLVNTSSNQKLFRSPLLIIVIIIFVGIIIIVVLIRKKK